MLDLSLLAPQQREAVTAPEQPVLITAVPGAGKTLVLTMRTAWLHQQLAIAPETILAISFSRKAVGEMSYRLRRIMGSTGAHVNVRTFESFGYGVISTFHEELGYKRPKLTVLTDAQELSDLIARAARDADVDAPVDGLSLAVSDERSTGRAMNPDVHAVVERYEGLLRERNAVDFVSMSSLPLKLFREHPAALQRYQLAFRAILIDECQDTSARQYELISLLAARHGNVTAVGDPMQAIYSWRGADGKFFELFRRDYPGLLDVTLDQNHRCSRNIVEFGGSLSAQLEPGRKMWTSNPPGEPVSIYEAQDPEDEARYVAEEVARLWEGGVVDPARMTVLYRRNAQAEPVVLALRERGIPYHVRGGADLFVREEVRDVVSYLRLANNLDDAHALARIVNTPPRNLASVRRKLKDAPVPPINLPYYAGVHGRDAYEQATKLLELLTGLAAAVEYQSPAEMIDLVLERTSYRLWLWHRPDGPERLANVEKLRDVAAKASSTLGEWLMDLMLDGPEPERPEQDALLLSSVHGSKGSESEVVYFIGCENGLLPGWQAINSVKAAPWDRSKLNDELRVAYVAVTRARSVLRLSHCRYRLRDGVPEPCSLSQFFTPYLPRTVLLNPPSHGGEPDAA
ncbi:MAG: ATP-dependent helicase [Chloroflexota bacterium]|nr:ATP-dependent helicase [Chloroflexota bacterium]